MFDENLTTMQQEKIMRYLIQRYRISCSRMDRYEECDCVFEHYETYKSDKTTKMLVENALKELDVDEQRIIQKSYIENNTDLWYLDYYTKSTYYRLKTKALSKFLHCLHV